MIIALLLLAVVAAGGLSILLRQANDASGRPLMVLGVLPIALLFLTVPQSVAVIQLLRGFQSADSSGAEGMKAVMALCASILIGLGLGALGFAVTMGAAVFFQLVYASQQPEAIEAGEANYSTLRTAILAASSTLVLLVAVVTYPGAALPQLIAEAVQGSHSDIAQSAAGIATYSLLATVGGVGGSIVLVVSAAGNLTTVRLGKPSPWLWRYSWVVLAACGLLASWILTRTLVGFRALE